MPVGKRSHITLAIIYRVGPNSFVKIESCNALFRALLMKLCIKKSFEIDAVIDYPLHIGYYRSCRKFLLQFYKLDLIDSVNTLFAKFENDIETKSQKQNVGLHPVQPSRKRTKGNVGHQLQDKIPGYSEKKSEFLLYPPGGQPWYRKRRNHK